MKKILFRKLLLDYLSFFLVAILSASLIIWVFQAVNYLDIIIDDGRDYVVYLNYTLFSFPKIISKILPFAFFFSFSVKHLITIPKQKTTVCKQIDVHKICILLITHHLRRAKITPLAQ